MGETRSLARGREASSATGEAARTKAMSAQKSSRPLPARTGWSALDAAVEQRAEVDGRAEVGGRGECPCLDRTEGCLPIS